MEFLVLQMDNNFKLSSCCFHLLYCRKRLALARKIEQATSQNKKTRTSNRSHPSTSVSQSP